MKKIILGLAFLCAAGNVKANNVGPFQTGKLQQSEWGCNGTHVKHPASLYLHNIDGKSHWTIYDARYVDNGPNHHMIIIDGATGGVVTFDDIRGSAYRTLAQDYTAFIDGKRLIVPSKPFLKDHVRIISISQTEDLTEFGLQETKGWRLPSQNRGWHLVQKESADSVVVIPLAPLAAPTKVHSFSTSALEKDVYVRTNAAARPSATGQNYTLTEGAPDYLHSRTGKRHWQINRGTEVILIDGQTGRVKAFSSEADEKYQRMTSGKTVVPYTLYASNIRVMLADDGRAYYGIAVRMGSCLKSKDRGYFVLPRSKEDIEKYPSDLQAVFPGPGLFERGLEGAAVLGSALWGRIPRAPSLFASPL